VTISWDELAALTLARQFPDRLDDVTAMVAATGPMQTQTARSAFLGLAARFPCVTHAAITRAYESGSLVRGSSIRGTVHTATPDQFAAMREACRTSLSAYWQRLLGLEHTDVAQVWSAVEQHADQWRTPAELKVHLHAWLVSQDEPGAARTLDTHPGNYLATATGGLVRRPATGSRWEGQGAPVYRRFDGCASSLADVVTTHLRSHGPASREDLSWWSGLSLTVIDSLLADVASLTSAVGPDGRTYVDLADAPAAREVSGVRLLPEFDALLCAYDFKRRDRFATPEHHALLWNRANGLLSPALLVDGRITGRWRSTGSAKRRPLEVEWFAGTRRPRKAELEQPIAALESALGITITQVGITRAS
jgi:hypothetical protein